MRTLLDIWNTNCSGYSFIKFSPAIYCAGYFYTKIAVLRFILYPVPNGSGFHPSTDGLYPSSARPSALFPRRSRMLRLILSGPSATPPPGPDFFTKYAKWPGCFCRQIRNLDYSCFSLSMRGRAVSPPPLFLHFDLSFCFLHFDFLFAFLSPIRYPLSALRYTLSAIR